jgi:hypothetical protein
VHGVRVPAWIVEHKENITWQLVLQEKNAEARRVMMQYYGWERVMAEVDAKLIDEHPDPKIGKLYEFFVNGQKYHVAVVQDGTPMYYEKGEPIFRTYTIGTRTSLHDIVSSLKDTYPLYRGLTNNQYLSLPRT